MDINELSGGIEGTDHKVKINNSMTYYDCRF